MVVRSSIFYISYSLAYCVTALSATGCSGSSSGTPNMAQSDMDGSTPAAAASIDPSPAAEAFCKNLELTFSVRISTILGRWNAICKT